MATLAHCAYCFESLSATFEQRQPLTLPRVEELWDEYTQAVAEADGPEDEQDTKSAGAPPAKPVAISRLLNPSSSSSTSSLSTTRSSNSSTPVDSGSSKASSVSSLPRTPKEASHPLFVTWNTVSKSGHKSLRGCIGTFEPLPLAQGLRSYALTSAFEDHRFNPIPASLLPSLQVCVTLLTNFSEPDSDPMNWTIGEHGIRLSFVDKGRRYGATYLPDVAAEQGWTKEETIVSLMRKAGWTGNKGTWRNVRGLEIVRYEGKKVELDYHEWEEWRAWVEEKGAGKNGFK
ncbi:AMMECR1 domain-containing protein [Elsinoe ampelina]|uniref:AMMECR1 domain-containing protein n=1 Tax=Elsinoe ampelina TaxID=302913 RepID=A0A6A6G2U6_9PEZI|nr:AMMECR1 domain-containing protein [Elsinoe ampelina]